MLHAIDMEIKYAQVIKHTVQHFRRLMCARVHRTTRVQTGCSGDLHI